MKTIHECAESKHTPITSSIGAYGFIMSIITYLEIGIGPVFWTYLFLTIVNGGLCAYQIYLKSKKEESKSVTFYFFAFDNFVFGLLLKTLFYKNIRIDNPEISSYVAFIIGLFLLIRHITKK